MEQNGITILILMVKNIKNRVELWEALSHDMVKHRSIMPKATKMIYDYDIPSKEKPTRKKRTKKNKIDLTIDHSFRIEEYWDEFNERIVDIGEDISDIDFENIQKGIDEFSDIDSGNLIRELLSIIFELTKNNQADFILLKHELTRELWENYVDLFNKIKTMSDEMDEKDAKRKKALSKLTKEDKILLGLE